MDRAEKAFRSYSILAGFGKENYEVERLFYDMADRLELADAVASDGHRSAADLGSQYGGMTHALKECGVRAVSTEYLDSHCKRYLKRVNDEVVKCDSFRLPLRNLDALVSYMFLGAYVPFEFRKGRSLGEVFDELSISSDTIYSVELQQEYSNWFGKKTLEPGEIEQKLKGTLQDFEVEPLGKFGVHERRLSFFPEGTFIPEKRLGFRFTRKEEAEGKPGIAPPKKTGGILGRILSTFSGVCRN